MRRPPAPRPRLAALAVAAAAAALGACAARPAAAPPAPAPDAWRSQTLALAVRGQRLVGQDAVPATWHGSAAWVAPGLAVTNAHVALRAREIRGEDDLGRRFAFDRVLALDREADLAILAAARPGEAPGPPLLPRPPDPKTLRGLDLRVVGNTGGLGLSLYAGRLTNAVAEERFRLGPEAAAGPDDGREVLLHDASAAAGAGGGPLFARDDGRLVGVNHATAGDLAARAAAPAWLVARQLAVARGRRGLPLEEAFDPQEMPVAWFLSRRVCLAPGHAFEGALQVTGAGDLAARVRPERARGLAVFQLEHGAVRTEAELLVGAQVRVYTLSGTGAGTLRVANPRFNAGPECYEVELGTIDWDRRLQATEEGA